MKQKILNLLILFCFFMVVFLGGYIIYENYNSDTIKIANWNLQSFGIVKVSNENLMQVYS